MALFSAVLLGQDRAVIEERFARLRTKEAERTAVLREMFAEAGCIGAQYKEQKVTGWKAPNLICTLPGTSSRTVIVTAHYDKTKKGEGAIDNWSGAALLPSLYQSLQGKPRRFTYTFILFMGEESGLIGSRYYVGQLTLPQRRDIAADVNIDSVGLPGYINIWASRANKDLRIDAATVASTLGIKLSTVNAESLVRDGRPDSDSHPFLDVRIPVIDFHSITPATMPLLHTAKDVPGAVDPATYFDTYRLLAAYLKYLDSAFEP
jgi:Zn-dependent M28 family amino/carboxypeptidase